MSPRRDPGHRQPSVHFFRIDRSPAANLLGAQEMGIDADRGEDLGVAWAYATRRADCIDAARLILLEAVERIPNAAILHYNLSCYECLLGDLEVAKARLQHAFTLEPRYRLKALEDEDLQPVWDSLMD